MKTEFYIQKPLSCLRTSFGLRTREGRRGGKLSLPPLVKAVHPSQSKTDMKVLRAIGLGIAILVLQGFASEVWHSFEQTIIALFNTMQLSLAAAASVIGSVMPPPH